VGAGLVVAQTPTGLAGMDAASGSVRWSHIVQFAAEARPTDIRVYFKMAVSVAGQAIYYSPDGALVEALRTSDGTRVWHSALVDDPALPLQYHVVDDVIVAAVTPEVVITKARYGVAALDRADGAIRWRYYSALEPGGMQAAVGDDGSVYALSWVHPKDTQISITAFASDNGAVRWQVPGPILRQAHLTPSGETVLAEDGGVLLAYRAADGVRTWDDTALYPGPLAASAYVVCIQSLDSVYLLKTTDGTKVWKLTGYGQEAMSLVLVPG
jgi:outer membrane protein assembly factor BamB